MRVLLDTTYVRYGPSGTAVYIERLAEALRATGEVELVEAGRTRVRRRGRRNPLLSARNAAEQTAWDHRGLVRAAKEARADVIHHPLPVLSRGTATPQVVTIHDVAFKEHPAGYGRAWRALAGRQYRRAARRAGAVICVSESTANEARTVLGVEPGRLVVARHGPGQRLPEVHRAEPPAHFLYVGDDGERKDVPALLGAYASYRTAADRPLGLVLAGRAARLAGTDGVRGEHEPGPQRLAELFSAAAALVHPSRHEGFGLTVLEAMAAGLPVVAVASAGVRETAGDAALLVDPAGLPGALSTVAEDAGLRERLGDAGSRRAGAFSWEASARRHVEAYTLAREIHGRAS